MEKCSFPTGKHVLLISGKARSGKDEFSSKLLTSLIKSGKTARIERISGPMKKWAESDFGGFAAILKGISNEIEGVVGLMGSHKDHSNNAHFDMVKRSLSKLHIKPENWHNEKTPLTRSLLQIYGTEIFQNRVDPDFWSRNLASRINSLDVDYIIVPDCRWPSNIEIVRENCPDCVIKTIRVERSGISHLFHQTETALDDYEPWDYVVENDGSLEDLNESAMVVVGDNLASTK